MFSCFDLRYHTGHRRAAQWNLIAHYIGQHLRYAFVKDMRKIDARARFQQLDREMRDAAVAAGAVLNRRRSRFCQRYQFLHRIGRKRWMRTSASGASATRTIVLKSFTVSNGTSL